MAEPKSIIIIGAGIAGLAAGIYGQMNGYRTEIFELHDLPGGLCMAWERKGYTFDGCIHYLFGTAPGAPFNRIWQDLGVAHRPFIYHDEMLRVTDTDSKTLIVYADPDRLAAHMKALSPADADLIDDFTGGIKQFTHFDMTLLSQKPKPALHRQLAGCQQRLVADQGHHDDDDSGFGKDLARAAQLFHGRTMG